MTEFSNGLKSLLGDILRNINSSIDTLRQDFKKLNELVIILTIRVEETKGLKRDLREVSNKIEVISSKIFELEKAKDKLEYLIREVSTKNKSEETTAHLTLEEKINGVKRDVGEITESIPLLRKVILGLIVAIATIIYITNQTKNFFLTVFSLVKHLF